jgi:ubiquinone/menaquinone biosynthesis C-methylase UbiE
MPSIGNLIYAVYASKSEVEMRQEGIRVIEWQAIAEFIPDRCSFLDVGCGTGYAMQRAMLEKQCEVVGIDPDPGAHGVGRFETERVTAPLTIQQGCSEQLPYEDNSFDLVYSSHVLEHVSDEVKSLQEMKRVLKPDGTLIIGVPTSEMAWIHFLSQALFTTHIKVYEFFRFLNRPGQWKRFVSVFRINSHSSPRASSVWYDIVHYRANRWKKSIEMEFVVKEMRYPLLYPYPDYKQLFKPKKMKWCGSSVFFICTKKQGLN